MNSPAEAIALIRRIERIGIELRPDGDRGVVLYRPAALMPDELGAELAANKWAVMTYLESRSRVDALLDPLRDAEREELRYQYEERAGIVEYDGKLPRDMAEEIAWPELGQELVRRLSYCDLKCAEFEARWARHDAARKNAA